MRCDNRGQLAGWEAVIILILIAYSGFITYKWATKPSEASVYQAESKPHIEEIHTAPFSCVREGKLNDFTVNGQANSSR